MKRGVALAALVCAAACAVYWDGLTREEGMNIPVTQVFSYTVQEALQPVEEYRKNREAEREKNILVLEKLHSEGDVQAGEYMIGLMERQETEGAVEGALAACGHALAVCALRENAVTVCVQEKIDEKTAGKIIGLCETITGIAAENIFILDECAYSW